MAESAARTVLERYGAIERLYCDEHWTTVIQEGQQLLLDVSRSADPVPEGLRERLELLMAHAYLYGFGDRNSAEDLYQAVLRSGAEASLRQIAEQGLQQCNLPTVNPGGAATAEAIEEPGAAAVAAAVAAAMAPTEPSRERGEAPRQAAAAPEPSSEAGAPLGLQEGAELAWLSPPAPPQGGAATPVMPWLQEAEGGSEASAPTLGSSPAAASVVEAGIRSGAASRPQVTPAAAADLAAATPPAVAAAEGARPAALAGSGEPLAAAPGSAESAGPDAAAGVVAFAGAGAESLARRGTEEILIPDVVEEPELVELRLADPELVEELQERLRQRLSRTGTAEAEPAPALSAAGTAAPLSLEKPPAEPAGVLDPSRSDPGGLDPATSADWTASGAPQGLIDAGEVDRWTPASHGRDAEPQGLAEDGEENGPGGLFRSRNPQRLRTPGPFASLPEVVGEEDSEMLMGLLKVELG